MTNKLTKAELESAVSFHPSVRSVIVVDRGGKVLESVSRPGAESMEPPEEAEKIAVRFAVARGMSDLSETFYGKMTTIIVRREKLVELLFPHHDHVVIVSAEPAFPLERVPQLERVLSPAPSA